MNRLKWSTLAAAGLATVVASLPAHAALVDVRVTVRNLAEANGVSFAPLHVGFHSGVFDPFDNGAVANAATISVAEGGSGGAWQTAFAAADPGAVRGTVGGLLQPGQTASSANFRVDTAANPFFSYGAMVVPSNDVFIGNDGPMALRLFDAAGNLALPLLTLRARQIWDAGSETFDPAAAAFVGNNDLRTPEGGVVRLDFAGLAGFDGLTTGTGYVFRSGLAADSAIYAIGFDVAAVPEPSALGLLATALGAAAWVRRGRGRSGAAAASAALRTGARAV